MSSPRNDLDDWLSRDVTPLDPPPGALGQIRHRARRRKTRQAVFAAAGCAVIVAAAVAVPELITAGGQHQGGNPPVAAGRSQATEQPGPSSSTNGANSPAPDTTRHVQLHQRTTLSTGTSQTVPPPNFRPTSVTVVGTGSGALVGAVIGQAGTPGQCATADCTSLAGTSSYGSSWYGVSAPVAPGPDGDTGVSQLRFASLNDGWAFGPGLYETSGGGWPWKRERTYGQRVLDVEAASGHALAIFARCGGSGALYASDCTSFALYASAAGSTSWTPVSVPAGHDRLASGQATAAALVISGGATGYLLTPTGAVLSGPVAGGSWSLAGQAPCRPGAALADGAPAGAQLAAGPGRLLLTCGTPASSGTASGGTVAQSVVLYTSANGATWHQAGSVPVPATGRATSLASAASGQVVLAATTGIYYSADNGARWQEATIPGRVPGGFGYVGMTTSLLGVAVPADAALGTIYVTRDGGKTWTPSPITG